MKVISLCFLLLMSLIPMFLSAETLITDAGREVSLNADGSWHYISDDRYATNAAGQRVRLQADGGWQLLSQEGALISEMEGSVFQNVADYQAISLAVAGLTIETYSVKASVSSKNITRKRQSVFQISVALNQAHEHGVDFMLTTSSFSVKDSSGDSYDVIGVAPSTFYLEPGEGKVIELRIDDSPTWRLGKDYEVQISGVPLSEIEPVILSIPLSQAKNIDVDGFAE